MKPWLLGALMVAAMATTALPFEADAKRLGGGRASGMQRNMPARTAPDAPPAKPATPQQAQPAQAGAQGAAPAAATPPKRSWMGPLAGLAAGLGLAALFSHLGLGAGMANFVMGVLLLGALAFGVMFLLRRFGGGARQPALAGAGAAAGAARANTPWQPAQREPAFEAPLQRSAEPVASAAAAPMGAAPAVSAEPAVTRAFVPAAFDSEGFARTAKMIFIRLQAANDTADLDDLRRFTTPELFASLRLDLQERAGTPQHTDVVAVDTEVLDVANEADRQVVSVRFHGQLVEEKGAAPTAFNEVWHLVKPHDDSRSWAIAGIEPLN